MRPEPNRESGRTVICASWDQTLAQTREMLLRSAGCDVISTVGPIDPERLKLDKKIDLIVLAHSIPLAEKLRILRFFRDRYEAPILSLLAPHQAKLPEADFGIEAQSPAEFMRVIRQILAIEDAVKQ